MRQLVDELVRSLQQHEDGAWSALAEMDSVYLPQLIEAYRACDTGDLKTRLALIEIIWQHRHPEALDFLLDVFHDKNREIWKAALDGFFAVDVAQAIQVLEEERQRYNIDPHRNRERLEWLGEAIAQSRREQIDSGAASRRER